MKYLIKYFFISVILSVQIFPQDDLERQFRLAEKLFQEENYFDAVTELKRLLFFDHDSNYFYRANYSTGCSYKMGAKFSEALKYFTAAEKAGKTGEEKYVVKTEIIKTNILAGRTAWALKLLDEMEKSFKSEERVDEINYWRGWAYIINDEWEKASSSFAAISRDHELKRLADSIEQQKYSVLFAKLSSAVIPGSGQFYTGNYLSGLISFGWNVLWGYLTINSFIEERYFDGIMTGNFLWLRFYSGSLQNAEKFAYKKNREISNAALEYLQNEYKGQKP